VDQITWDHRYFICWLRMLTSNRGPDGPNNSQVDTVDQGQPESAKKRKILGSCRDSRDAFEGRKKGRIEHFQGRLCQTLSPAITTTNHSLHATQYLKTHT
jgi:hypothetical protein